MEAITPITDDEVSRIDAALVHAKGSRAAAARLLGIKADRVYVVLKHNPAMRLKWGLDKPEVPDVELGEIDRKPSLVSPRDEAVSAAIAKQDNMLSAGVRGTGLFKDEEVDFLSTLETTYGQNIVGTLQLAQAGMAHSLVKLLMLQRSLEARIAEVDSDPDKFYREMSMPGGVTNVVKEAHEFRLELTDRLLSVTAEIRKMAESGNKAALTRAQVEKIKADLTGGDGKQAKPGFARGGPPVAIQVNASAGSTVTVREGP